MENNKKYYIICVEGLRIVTEMFFGVLGSACIVVSVLGACLGAALSVFVVVGTLCMAVSSALRAVCVCIEPRVQADSMLGRLVGAVLAATDSSDHHHAPCPTHGTRIVPRTAATRPSCEEDGSHNRLHA